MKYSAPGLPSLLRLSELLTKTEALPNLCKVDKCTSFAEVYMEIQKWSYLCRLSAEKWVQNLGSPASFCTAGIMKAWCNFFIPFVESFFFYQKKRQNTSYFSNHSLLTAEPFWCLLQNAKLICDGNGKGSGATGGIRRKPICGGVKQSS